MRKLKVAIDIPSGILICANDLRGLFPTGKDFYVNQMVGIKQTVEAYAKKGLFHAFCSASYPDIFQDGNKIVIGNMAQKDIADKRFKELQVKWLEERVKDRSIDKYEAEDYFHYDPKAEKWAKKVGCIDTELWWYSVADYNDFEKRGGIFDDDEMIKVAVEPGRYVLIYDLEYNDGGAFGVIKRSDEEIVFWKMPEEDAGAEILALLPEKFSAVKIVDTERPSGWSQKQWEQDGYAKKTIQSYIYVDRYFKDKKHSGYKMWGCLYDGEKECGIHDALVHDCIVTEEQLMDRQSMADMALMNFENERDRKEKIDEEWDKIQKELSDGEKEEIREEIKEKIKKLLAMELGE